MAVDSPQPAFDYRISPTALRFHGSDAFIRGLVGPFASGKTTTVMEELAYLAMDQPASRPNARGERIRYSRFGVIRRTYPNLKSITREMLMKIMPPGSGYITQGNAPLSGTFRFWLPDGTMVHMEAVLWALEDERSLENIRSSNWTAVLLNEATEMSASVIPAVMSRINRYPDRGLGGVKWGGILMDFNPAPPDHWLHGLFARPYIEFGGYRSRVELFAQPPAAFKIDQGDGTFRYEINPEAENLENLEGGARYYADQIGYLIGMGRPEDYETVDLQFCMLSVKPRHGRLVFPQFSRERHVASRPLEPLRGQPVVVGFDTSGHHFAAVIGQLQHGRWCVLGELQPAEEMSLDTFINGLLVPHFPAHYPGCPVVFSCDPANARDQWTLVSPVGHLEDAGFVAKTPDSNGIDDRIGCVASMLNKDYGGLMVSPRCRFLLEALERDYHYPKHRILGTADYAYSDKPAKNAASHVADALQYMCLHVARQGRRDDAGAEAMAAMAARHNAACRAMRGAGAIHV
ncbi:MAG: hypothetical protein LBL95_00020 [Deltaproteobacteria bacterium]|jgi:hypothetical protein|nr:hypothetical protein [Deltaproteobacteria bacterium]